MTGVIKVVGSGATDQVQCWGRRGYEGRDYWAQTAVFGFEDRDVGFPVDLLRLTGCSQILCRRGPGLQEASAAVTPRIELRRLGPCQAFLSNALSRLSTSTWISGCGIRMSGRV